MAIDKIVNKHKVVYRTRILLPNGQRKSRCFTRKVDAEMWEAKIKLEGSDSSQFKRHKTRFNDLTTLFLNNHAKVGLAFASYKRYESTIRMYILPKFDGRWIEEISKLDAVEFRAQVENLKLSGSMRNFIFAAFKTMMRKAQEWDLLEKNPTDGIKPPKKGMSRTEYWTESEVKQFLAAMHNSPHLSVYLIALNTGMRISEIFGLKWDCVDLENKFINVRRMFCQKSNLVKETTKTHRSRHIGINATLHNLFLKLKANSKSEFVFEMSGFGFKKASHASRILRDDCRKAGVREIKFHDLRHTFATQFVMNEGSIHALSGMLGHTTTAMTARYAHYGPEHARRAAQVVSFDVPEIASVVRFDQEKRKKSDQRGHKMVTEH